MAYLGLNLLNNTVAGSARDPGLVLGRFHDRKLHEHWALIDKGSSAARALSNLLWMSLPWKHIAEKLGPLHVVDVGCGSGEYGARLEQWSGLRFASYTGLDRTRSPNWDKLRTAHPHFRFVAADAERIRDHLPEDANVFISQSALEHVAGDLEYFRAVHEFIVSRRRQSVNIHLVPGPLALPLYLCHGIRQYSLRTLSYISRLFGGCARTDCFGLGGWRATQLHFRSITLPILLRRGGDLRGDPSYDQELKAAITADMEQPSSLPIFYALVIQAYLDQDILRSNQDDLQPWQ